MGDIADEHFNQMMDYHPMPWLRRGSMPARGPVQCKFCGCIGLRWEHARGQRNRKIWQLVDRRGTVHDCSERVTVTEDELVDLDDLTA